MQHSQKRSTPLSSPSADPHFDAESLSEKRASEGAIADLREAPFWTALAIFIGIVGVFIDIWTQLQLNISILYVLPLVIAAFGRSRTVLWGLCVFLIASTFIIYSFQIPPGRFTWREPFFDNRVLASITLLITGLLTQARMRMLAAIDAKEQTIRKHNELLAAANLELIRYKEEITVKNRELEQRRREADDASERKTRILASASHDMRSTLTGMQLISALLSSALKAESAAPDAWDLADRIEIIARQLNDLLGDVMDVATFASGRIQLHETEFALDELLSTQIQTMRPIAEAKNIELSYEPVPLTCCIRTDRIKLGRVINNLVNNAIKFTDQGSVHLCGRIVSSGDVRIEVRDTGIGIPTDKLETIFDDFVQLPSCCLDRTASWGLGLAISRRLVEAVGGTITVRSEVGTGSIFTIRLPATRNL